MKLMSRKLHKIVSLISGLSLVFNSILPSALIPVVFAQPAYAQEATPTETIAPTPTDTVTPTPDATPTIIETPTEIPTPTEEVTPTPEPTITTPTPTEVVQPTETGPPSTPTPEQGQILDGVSTVAPTPTITTTPKPKPEHGTLQAMILSNTNAQTLAINFDSTQPSGSATLTTDKADYAPTDSAVIAGTGFTAGETYTVIITSQDPPAVTHEAQVTANAQGDILYTYQLDGNYRPNYTVQAKDVSGQVIASVTFTDDFAGPVTVTPATGGSLINSSTAGGAYTAIAGPTLQEESNQTIGVGTIILNVPTGFEFDTSSTVTVTLGNRPGGDGTNLTLSSGTALVATNTITITVTSPDQSGTTRTILWWSGIKVRPTAVSPLANGNITKSGTANINGVVNGSTNLGTLNEVDDTHPTAAITYSAIPSSVKPGDTLYITAMFSEPMADSPVPKIAISGANTVAATNMTKNSSTNYYFSYIVGSGDGTATVTLSEGRDLAGLTVISTPTSGASFTVDSIAPTCPAPTITKGTNPGAQYIVGSTIYYTTMLGTGSFTVSENATDTTDVPKVNFPNTVSWGGDVTSPPYQKTYTWISSPESTYNGTATITCQDNVGNTATSAFIVNKDNTLPVVNSITLDKYFVKDGATITVTSSVTETGSGISSCHAWWSNTPNFSGTYSDVGDLGTDCSGSITVPAGTGTYYVLIASSYLGLGDNVGLFQPSGLASAGITMDNTAPSTTDDAGPGNGTFLTSKTVTLTPDDHGGSGVADTKYCIVDSTDIPLVCTPTISGTSVVVSCPGVASCSKIIFYSSTDNAGNIEPLGTHSHYINIVNDTTPPSTTDNIDGNWHKTDVTVTLTCNDTGGSTCGNTYYTTDGSNPDTSSSTGNSFTLSADGEYTIKYFSKDTSGNTETVKTAANHVKIDKTNPTGSITSPTSGSYLKGTVAINATASDNSGSGIDRVEFYHNSVPPMQLIGQDSTSPYSINWDTTAVGDGSHGIIAKIFDLAGNSYSTPTIPVIVDNTAPVFTSKTTFSGWYNSNQTSTFTYTEATSGIASGTPVTCVINTEGSNQTCSVTPNVCDNAGNCNTTLVTSNGANIDKTAPTGAATIANDYYGPNTYDQLTTINGTASDSGSGVAKVELSVLRNSSAHPEWFTDCWEGWQWGGCPLLATTYVPGSGTWTYGSLPTLYLTDGISYQIYPIVTDNAGNSTNGTADVFIWDDQNPISHVTTLPTTVNTANFTIAYTASDPMGPSWSPMQKSGLKNVDLYYRLDSGSWTKYGTFTSSPISFTASSDGTYGFYTIARDNVLNEETAKTSAEATTIVDTTDPAVASVDSDGQTYNLATVSPHTIKVTFNENIANIPMVDVHTTVGNQSVNNCGDSDAKTFCFNYTIPAAQEMQHTIYVTNAQDAAGNTMVLDNGHTFTVDTVAPTTTPSVYSNPYVFGNWTNGQITMRMSCNDGTGSGCASTYYCVDQTNTCTPTTPYSGFNVNTEGVNYVRFYSSDNAGNSETIKSVQVKIDMTRPVANDDYGAKDGVWQNSDQTITLTASDAGGSGLQWTKYCFGNAIVNGVSCYPESTGTECTDPASCTIPITDEGEKYLTYASQDIAGTRSNYVNRLIKIDKTAPSGGSITYTDGYYNAASPSVALTVNEGTDTGSGINTGSSIVRRSDAVLANGTCGSFVHFVKIYPSGSYPNFTDTTVSDGNCYMYEYLVYDNVFNQAIYNSVHVAKVDTSAPSAPGTPSTSPNPTNSTTQTWNWSSATDAISGILQYAWRASEGSNGIVLGTSTTTNLLEGIWNFFVKAIDNAGNESSESSGSVTVDTTAPILTSAVTRDLDGNGKIDAIELTFNEMIDKSKLALSGNDGWNVDGYTIAKVDTENGLNDTALVLQLHENASPDTGNKPTITYTKQLVFYSTHDVSGNQLESLSVGTTDGAKPVLVSAETQDTDGNGKIDAIKLTFSENIDDEMLNPGTPDGWDVVGYDGASIGTGDLANDNILVLKINEGTSYDDDATPTITYTPSIQDLKVESTHDLAGNQLADYSGTTTDNASPAPVNNATGGGGGGGGAGDGLSDGLGNTTACTNSKPGSAPTLLSAVAGTNSVTLTWSEASNPVTYYLITYGTGPGLQQYGHPNVGPAGTTSYTVNNLSGAVTYYFKVRAGNGCMPGDFSNELSATPGGGFVQGPATGFEAGVLGTTTVATPSPSPTPQTGNVLAGQAGGTPWWSWIGNIFAFLARLFHWR